jgi:hypothetical protein
MRGRDLWPAVEAVAVVEAAGQLSHLPPERVSIVLIARTPWIWTLTVRELDAHGARWRGAVNPDDAARAMLSLASRGLVDWPCREAEIVLAAAWLEAKPAVERLIADGETTCLLICAIRWPGSGLGVHHHAMQPPGSLAAFVAAKQRCEQWT